MLRLIPVSTLWNYPGLSPTDVISEFDLSDYLRYVRCNIELMGNKAFHPTFDIDYANHILKEAYRLPDTDEYAQLSLNNIRSKLTKLILVLAKHNLDRVEDYAYLFIDLETHRNYMV